MKIIEIIEQWFKTTRRTGYSSVIANLSDQEQVRFLCPDRDSAKRFGDKGITLYDLPRGEGNNWIVILDNHFILKWSEAVRKEDERKQRVINAFKDHQLSLAEAHAKLQDDLRECAEMDLHPGMRGKIRNFIE